MVATNLSLRALRATQMCDPWPTQTPSHGGHQPVPEGSQGHPNMWSMANSNAIPWWPPTCPWGFSGPPKGV